MSGHFEVGILEHDERRVAAQLERHPFDLVRRLAHDRPADFGRACEADLAHKWVFDQLAPDGLGIEGGDDVGHARGQTCLLEELEDRDRGERRLLRLV